MGFFDGLEQKMKNASEASNLNGQIRENEKLIDKYYYDLGKLYFEKHGNSPSPEAEEICKAIASCIEKIDLLKKDLVIVKGLKLCPSCGAECPADVPFCSTCGSKLPMPEPEVHKDAQEVVFCGKCGNKLTSDASFCPSCGTPVTQATPTPEAAEEPAIEEPDITLPKAEEPDIKLPPVEEPDIKLPEAEAADIELPSVGEPDIKLPEVEEPDVKLPPVEEPDIKLPEAEAISESIPAGMKKCASCGAYVVEKAIFCGNCGLKF